MTHTEKYQYLFESDPTPGVYDLVSLESLANLTPHSEQQYLPGWLTVSFSLFFIGMTGMVYNYKNFLITMMCVEIMYLGAITGFIMYGLAFHDVLAAIYALLILIFAACESAIGLGLLVAVYRYGRSIGFNSFVDLGG